MRYVMLLALVLCSRALADPVPPDLSEVMRLARQPFLDRDAAAEILDSALPEFEAEAVSSRARPTEGDPYFWALSGHFGPPLAESAAPGGVATCARYGQETLAYLQQRPSSDPAVFPLIQRAVILHDDAAAWPEGAVARLVCAITWDDMRRVAPLALSEVDRVLQDMFERYSSGPDPSEEPDSVRVFGPGGYVVLARDGPSDLTVHVDMAHVMQLATHQLILFRSYLMGGGV